MRKLSESVWGSIRKKSMGQEDRAEDGLEKFCEKLQSMYEIPDSRGRITIQDDKICVYIFKNKLNMYTTLWIENVEKDRDYVTLAGTNPAKYRFSPSTMPLKVHTLGIYAVIKNKFKVEETESDGLEHWLHLKISHKDGSIFTNKDCINLIDLILNSIEDGKGIFPLLSKNVNESVWGNIRKKSLGQEERLENDVNHMSFDDFTAFITDTYSKNGNWFSISDSVSGKDLHIDLDIIDGITLKYNVSEGKLYNILIDVHDKNLKPLNISKLENDFQIEQLHQSPTYEVRNLDGTISNNTYVKLIEFFMANKDTLLMESVWGDIRKKSLGQKTRIEDDINLLDKDLLHTYLLDNYELVDSDVKHIKEYGHSCIWSIYVTASINLGSFQDCNTSLYFKKFNDVKIFNVPKLFGESKLFTKLEAKYRLEKTYEKDRDIYTYIVFPKDRNIEINNSFFLDVLDFIIDNNQNEFDVEIKKKQKMKK